MTRLLITDLDNTVYDWVSFHAAAVTALAEAAAELLHVPLDVIFDDLRAVNQRFGTMERPYALLETGVVSRSFPGASIRERAIALEPAFRALEAARARALRLYPGLRETLEKLAAECIVVAHTESSAFNASQRLETFGLTRFFARVYATSDGEFDDPFPESARRWSIGERLRTLGAEERKPDPRIVLDICRDFGVDVAHTAYVGDSLPRDVLMAKQAGARAVWARYGTRHSEDDWNRVLRVSHWTDADVRRDQQARRALAVIEPDAIIDRFADLPGAL